MKAQFASWPRPAIEGILLLLLALALWVVYRPGLSGPYVFDDFSNISRNSRLAIQALSLDSLIEAAFSKVEGGFGRPLAMASFALNYWFGGRSFDPWGFKLVNLAIHLFNAVLVYFFARSLLGRVLPAAAPGRGGVLSGPAPAAATFAAAFWALHPLQLTSVLYAVQRMTSLSALFVLAGLLVYLHGRQVLGHSPRRGFVMMSAGIAGGGMLGVLCKENAALIPLFAACIELVFFPRGELEAPARKALAAFYLLFVVLPFGAIALYLAVNPDFVLASYGARSFGLVERVLTEARVLFFYLSLIALPLISRFGLYHDDFVLSTGLLDPATTIISLAGWALALAAMAAGLRRRRVWAFGLAWFLAGHAMESTLLGLEIIHEHRNYLPSVGICVAATYYLASLFRRLAADSKTAVVCGLCVLLVLGFVTHIRAQAWGSRPHLFEYMVRHHPNSYRALAGLATTMREQGRDVRAVYKTLRDAALANPETVYPLIEMQKMLYAMISVSDRVVGVVVPAPDSGSARSAWARDPVLDRDYLTEIDVALAVEIERRLTARKPHTETVYALWTAQKCVINGHDQCLPLLDRFLKWHLLVLGEVPAAGQRQAMLQLSTAKLYAARGELETALEYTDRAIASAPGHARFKAQKAILLTALGDLQGAARLADEIERGMDWRRLYEDDVKVLRQVIERKKSARGDKAAQS